MEGMPRFAPIVPDLKKPVNEYDEEFVYSLKEYILMHFQAEPSDYDAAISEFRQIKLEVMKCHVDVEAVCILKRYFAQLLMMKNRFPMEGNGEVRAIFSWYERALDMPTAQSFADINFEMACVIYQIGAIHAAIAALENRQSDDSIKNAFMHFQYAAWPLQYLRDNMDVGLFGTSDFDKDLLTFHINILLAQAQECLLEKSMLDSRRSPITVVKLATYLRDLYSQCNTLLKNSSTTVEMLSAKKYKTWSRTVAVKSEVYGCIAMLYMAYQEESEQHYGTRLSWCQAADFYLGRAVKSAGDGAKSDFYDTLSFIQDIVKGKLENAKKENDFIYHERVPKYEDLIITVTGDCKVSPRSFDPLDPSIGGEDIFGSLVPPTVLAAVSQYEEEKAKLKREVLTKVAGKDNELQDFLSRLNAAELGLTSGPSFVLPDILLERNASMHSQIDAVPRILEKLQQVDKLARDSDSQLNALSSRLRAITLPEFLADEGYNAITAEIGRLTEHHIQARGLNAELHKALAAHSTNIHLLSLPLRELTEKIAPQSEVNPASTAEGQALIRVLEKAMEMQTQRAMLIDNFSKELAGDSINKKLLAERDTDNRGTFAEELKKHDKVIQFINANLVAQDNILHHLTEANADFSEQRNTIQKMNKDRFEQVMTLVAAFDIYADVSSKTDDGKKFYENLIRRIEKLGTAVEAIEAAYQQEVAKLEAERRSVEEKKAAIQAARDARDALADFGGGVPTPSMSQPQQLPAEGGRPRLGDYMQFYRKKMAAKGQLPSGNQQQHTYPPQMPPPTHLSMVPPEQGYMYQGPPSPAPSSIAGDFHHEHYKPFISPVPSSHSNQVTPVDQRLPTLQSPAQQFPPPQPLQQIPHPHAGQYGAFPPNVSLPTSGVSSVHSSASELSRINQSATPVPPVPPPIPQRITPEAFGQQYIPAGHPAASVAPQLPIQYNPAQNAYFPQPSMQPQFHQPTPPLAAASVPQIHPGQQLQLTSPQAGYGHQQMSSVEPTTRQQYSPPQQPLPVQTQTATYSVPQQGPHMYKQQLPQPPFQQMTQQVAQHTPSTQISPRPVVSQTSYGQQFASPQSAPPAPIQQQYQLLVHPAPHQSAFAPIAPQPSYIGPQPPQPNQLSFIPSTTPKVDPSIQATPQAASQFYPPPAAPKLEQQSQPPSAPTPAPVAQPAASWGAPRAATAQPGVPSPWHQSQAPSPWHHAGQIGPFPAQPTPHAQNTPVMGVGTPQATGQILGSFPGSQPPVIAGSNVDLLSSLLGDLNLPAAIAPSQPALPPQTIAERHVLQQTAPATTVRPAEQPVVRPAAAVIPIQHMTPQNMVPPMTAPPPVAPSQTQVVQPPQQITDLTNPEKFHLGEGDKTRLEKRHLHAAIRGSGPLPSLDPLDPLNQLDPFWGVKKT